MNIPPCIAFPVRFLNHSFWLGYYFEMCVFYRHKTLPSPQKWIYLFKNCLHTGWGKITSLHFKMNNKKTIRDTNILFLDSGTTTWEVWRPTVTIVSHLLQNKRKKYGRVKRAEEIVDGLKVTFCKRESWLRLDRLGIRYECGEKTYCVKPGKAHLKCIYICA